MALFPGLCLLLTLFRKLFDQVNITLEVVILGDEQIKGMELVGGGGKRTLHFL